MPPKYTIDYIKQQFIQNDCILLESKYINNKTKMKYICSCGNDSEITFNNFQQGQRCTDCGYDKVSHKLKLDYNYVNGVIRSKGWILNSNTYENNYTKLNLTCPNNHTCLISFNDFTSNKGCKTCLNKLYPSIDFIKNYSEKNGFKCLSNTYTNSHKKLKFKCGKNHIFKMMWYKFYNGNQRCRQCYLEENIGENHSRWNDDRTKHVRSSYLSFDKKKYQLLKDDPNYLLYLFYKNLSEEKIIDRNIYEIDHIFPRKAFIDNNLDILYNLTVVKKICNLRENLRIIHVEENSHKSAKYNQEEFMGWFNKIIHEHIHSETP